MDRERLTQLIESLPEIYQPIYGHPEHPSSRASSGTRLEVLDRIVALLQQSQGRTLRILDLGSSQGYIALTLAAQGHHVTGVDFLAPNVEMAQFLASEHPECDASFLQGDITNIAELVDLDSYDLVLGFSVFHHLADRDGHDETAALIERIAAKIPHALFEMALDSEPLYWAQSLPLDPRATLAGYAFITELGRESTHLSGIQRPLLFCSRSHVLYGDQLKPIVEWSVQSHREADSSSAGIRRYYQLDGGIAKLAASFSDDPDLTALDRARMDLRREAHVLSTLDLETVEHPQLWWFNDGLDETLVVHSWLNGVTLDHLIGSLSDDDRTTITTHLLTTLAALEGTGLYHNDLRTWNVVWDADTRTAHLIDFGALRTQDEDCVWPFDAAFSLVTFLTSLWGRLADQTGLRVPRASQLDAASLPPAAAALVSDLLEHADDDQVFRDALQRWQELKDAGDRPWPTTSLAWKWLTATELELRSARERVNELERQLTRAHEDHATAHEELLEMHRQTASVLTETAGQRDGLRTELDLLQQERDLLVSHRDALQAELDAVRQERDTAASSVDSLQGECERLDRQLSTASRALQTVYDSRSWRLTAPLRAVFERRRAG